jgi:hypothetical protein
LAAPRFACPEQRLAIEIKKWETILRIPVEDQNMSIGFPLPGGNSMWA